ncbi:MAG: hypothetical protein ACRYFW_00310 [Janthinobacterium lividum]
MTVSAALAEALAAARPALNARVAAARKAQPGFDANAVGAIVRGALDPVVAAVAEAAPGRVAEVVAAGFEMIVALVAQRLIGPGARRPVVDRLWAEVAPAYAALVAERPVATLGRLTNAALRLDAAAGVRVEEWLRAMRALAPLLDADTLAPAGQVAAWRAGMAHYREGALRAADALPDAVALAATGATGSWAEVRARLAADRWWTPAGGAGPVSFGGFAGLGGPFAEPPEIAAAADGFLVRSGERHGLLVADACGATLHPASADEFAAAVRTPGPRVGPAGIEAGDRTIAVDLPTEGLVAVAIGHSVGVASPFSHFVEVHPWCRP